MGIQSDSWLSLIALREVLDSLMLLSSVMAGRDSGEGVCASQARALNDILMCVKFEASLFRLPLDSMVRFCLRA